MLLDSKIGRWPLLGATGRARRKGVTACPSHQQERSDGSGLPARNLPFLAGKKVLDPLLEDGQPHRHGNASGNPPSDYPKSNRVVSTFFS
jgi:hypothetical protein